MKDKGLFAKTGIAKIMALLATLLTMFASCNFLGGEEARAVVGGTNAPNKYTKPGEPGEALPPFKSLSAATVQPWVRDWGDKSPLFTPIYESGEFIVQPANDSNGENGGGYFAGVFGAFDNGVATGAKFDVSKVSCATYEVKASEPVAGFMITLTNPNPAKDKEDEVVKEAKIDLTTEWQTKKISNYYSGNGVEIVARLFCSGDDSPKATTDTKIYLRNFIFYDKDGNEVVPQYYADGNVPELPSDGSTTVILDGVKYNYGGDNGTWFGQQGAWDPTEQQPTVEQTSDGVKVTVKEKNGTEQWKGQIKLKSETEVVSGKKYDITVVVRSTQTFNGNVTYKPQLKSITNENDNYAFEERGKQTVLANQDATVEFKGKSVDKDGMFQMTFDFPGCDAGTEILIKSLTFKESSDQTKDDFLLGGIINANGTGGDIQFPFADIPDASEYHLYIGDSATPARVFRSDIDGGQRRIEIKHAFKKESNLLDYPYCRKVGEVFPNGAGEYEIKIVPVIGDKEDASKAMTSKYTLTADKTGWMPKIEGVVLNPQPIETSGKLTGITFAYSANPEIDSFNVFVKKRDVPRDISQGKWGGVNPELIVKNGDNILESVSNLQYVFKDGAGMYEIYFEPVKTDGTIGTNIALSELDVKESWLN